MTGIMGAYYPSHKLQFFLKKNPSGARGYACQLRHEIRPNILHRTVKIDFRIAKMDFTGKAMVTGRPVIDFFSLQRRHSVAGPIPPSFFTPFVVFCHGGHPPILLHISCSDLVPFSVFPVMIITSIATIKIAVAQNGFYDVCSCSFIV